MNATDERLEALARILRRVEPTSATRALAREVACTIAHGSATMADVLALEEAADALKIRSR